MKKEIELTNQDIWQATFLFGAAGFVLLIVLSLVFTSFSFYLARAPLAVASGLFWGLLFVAAAFGFWDIYYGHFYPAWSRRLLPLGFVFYVLFSLVMWLMSTKLPGSNVVWFALLGGFEGVLEHFLGIRVLGILDKVPQLRGVDPVGVLVFSFFEYLLYWTLVGWLAYGILQIF